jgi:hypothetical protein
MAPKWKETGSQYTVKRENFFNSRRSDYSPMLTGDNYDQLYFTSTRNQAQGDELSGITGTKNGDIFVSYKDENGKWLKPEVIDTELNSAFDEGACSFTPDSRTMYLTQCTTDPSYPRYASICTSKRSDAAWSKPTVLELTKDTLSSYAHPAVSPDGEWLYFTSDMPGGMGGLDIWRIRVSDKGMGGVENLGEPVNTPGDEMFPTFRPNGDLYFSSNGHPGMGGLDIFIAKPNQTDELNAKTNNSSTHQLKNSSTQKLKNPTTQKLNNSPSSSSYIIEHPGYPLNSPGDDFGMTFNGLLNEGYFS